MATQQLFDELKQRIHDETNLVLTKVTKFTKETKAEIMSMCACSTKNNNSPALNVEDFKKEGALDYRTVYNKKDHLSKRNFLCYVKDLRNKINFVVAFSMESDKHLYTSDQKEEPFDVNTVSIDLVCKLPSFKMKNVMSVIIDTAMKKTDVSGLLISPLESRSEFLTKFYGRFGFDTTLNHDSKSTAANGSMPVYYFNFKDKVSTNKYLDYTKHRIKKKQYAIYSSDRNKTVEQKNENDPSWDEEKEGDGKEEEGANDTESIASSDRDRDRNRDRNRSRNRDGDRVRKRRKKELRPGVVGEGFPL
jgi:hypothetical protein